VRIRCAGGRVGLTLRAHGARRSPHFLRGRVPGRRSLLILTHDARLFPRLLLRCVLLLLLLLFARCGRFPFPSFPSRACTEKRKSSSTADWLRLPFHSLRSRRGCDRTRGSRLEPRIKRRGSGPAGGECLQVREIGVTRVGGWGYAIGRHGYDLKRLVGGC
jgi:hypothetical protein